jgi:hypothetical protein
MAGPAIGSEGHGTLIVASRYSECLTSPARASKIPGGPRRDFALPKCRWSLLGGADKLATLRKTYQRASVSQTTISYHRSQLTESLARRPFPQAAFDRVSSSRLLVICGLLQFRETRVVRVFLLQQLLRNER